MNAVPPREVNLAFLKHGAGDRRNILHYQQPHPPFLSLGKLNHKDKKKVNKDKKKVNICTSDYFQRFNLGSLRRWVEWKLSLFLGWDRIWKAYEKLRLKPRLTEERIYRESLNSKFTYFDLYRRYYEDNLRKVLRKVAALVEKIDREVIITSDHGQLLSEKHVPVAPTDRHPPGEKIKALIEVPWFKVK